MGRIRENTPDKLPEGWYESLLECARQGASICEMAAELGLARSSFYLMADEFPEFKATIEDLRQISQVWWERQGRRFVTENNSGGSVAWIFQMKNRFPDDYRDKREIAHDLSSQRPVERVTIEVIHAAQDPSDETAS